MNRKCKSCNSGRFRIIAKSYCKRCYPIIRKIEIVNQWNLSDLKTLKYYPKESLFHNEKDFKKIKSGHIVQCRERLKYLKLFETILNDEISGINIVSIFQKIAKLAGSRNKDFLWHEEDLFDRNFNPMQKKILFKVLNDIVESIPWRGIDWNRIFMDQ